MYFLKVFLPKYASTPMEDSRGIICLYHSNMRELRFYCCRIIIESFRIVCKFRLITQIITHFCKLFSLHGFSLFVSSSWSQTSTIGYFGELMFGIFSSLSFSVVNGAILVFFIPMFRNHQAFYKRFRHSVCKLNHRSKSQDDKELLCELIHFQNSIRRCVCVCVGIELLWYKKEITKIFLFHSWFYVSADVYSFTIMIELLYFYSTLGLARAIFQLKLVRILLANHYYSDLFDEYRTFCRFKLFNNISETRASGFRSLCHFYRYVFDNL